MPVMAPDGSLQCSFSRRKSALSRGLRYIVEHTTNISDENSWTDTGVVETSAASIDDAFDEVSASLPFDENDPRGFVRLHVEFVP